MQKYTVICFKVNFLLTPMLQNRKPITFMLTHNKSYKEYLPFLPLAAQVVCHSFGKNRCVGKRGSSTRVVEKDISYTRG